jgi:hypothetical protein
VHILSQKPQQLIALYFNIGDTEVHRAEILAGTDTGTEICPKCLEPINMGTGRLQNMLIHQQGVGVVEIMNNRPISDKEFRKYERNLAVSWFPWL